MNKKTIIIIAAVVVVLGLICACCGGGTDDEGKSAQKTVSTNSGGGKKSGAEAEAEDEAEELTVADIFTDIQGNGAVPYNITEKALETLKNKPELFVDNSDENIEENTNYGIESKQIAKNVKNYGDELIFIFDAKVVSIFERTMNGIPYTIMILQDEEYNYYSIFSLTTYEDIYEDDYVDCYALPMDYTTYENAMGGTTWSVIGAGAYVAKYQ